MSNIVDTILEEKELPEPKPYKLAIIAVGLPNSGKSTAYETFCVDTHELLSSDYYIEEYAKQNNLTYDQAFRGYIDVAQRKFEDKLNEYVTAGKDIFVDRTNLNVKSRSRIIEKLQKNNYFIVCWVFHTPLAVLEERNEIRSKTGKTISTKVYYDMIKRYEEPTYDEGFSAIIDFKFDGDKILRHDEA